MIEEGGENLGMGKMVRFLPPLGTPVSNKRVRVEKGRTSPAQGQTILRTDTS